MPQPCLEDNQAHRLQLVDRLHKVIIYVYKHQHWWQNIRSIKVQKPTKLSNVLLLLYLQAEQSVKPVEGLEHGNENSRGQNQFTTPTLC